MTHFVRSCATEHNSSCARCGLWISCPACAVSGQDNRGRGAGYCHICVPHGKAGLAVVNPETPPATAAPEPSFTIETENTVVSVPAGTRPLGTVEIDTREVLTTERTRVGREESLARYLRATVAHDTVRPVALMRTCWLQDELAAERARGGPNTRVDRLRDALEMVGVVRFCVLDGDHRCLAAALLGRPVRAVIIETPAHLDEWRRTDPAFPHPELQLPQLARKWLDWAFGSLAQAAFDVAPLTVSERSELIESAGALPRSAADLARRGRASRSALAQATSTCSCLPEPGTPMGAFTWREYAERRGRCLRHGDGATM